MPFTVAAVLLAVGAGYLRGGRLHRIAEAPVVARWLLAAGLTAQVLLELAVARGLVAPASPASWATLAGSQLLVLAWLARNRWLAGTGLIAAGVACNAVVIAANGAMPVSPAAIRALGGQPAALEGGKHLLASDATRLSWLADVLPVPGLGAIISIGDVLLALGLMPLVVSLMADGRRRGSDAQPLPVEDA